MFASALEISFFGKSIRPPEDFCAPFVINSSSTSVGTSDMPISDKILWAAWSIFASAALSRGLYFPPYIPEVFGLLEKVSRTVLSRLFRLLLDVLGA